jgi:hypothetical protein
LKDDPNEIAMSGRRPRPSVRAIAGIFTAVIILSYLLLFTPRDGFFPKPRQNLLSPKQSEHDEDDNNRYPDTFVF